MGSEAQWTDPDKWIDPLIITEQCVKCVPCAFGTAIKDAWP